jgi:PDZ domain
MTTLTPKMAQENNKDPNSPVMLPEINGVLVIKVLPNTPAASAGIKWGDVVLSVDGQSIENAIAPRLLPSVQPNSSLRHNPLILAYLSSSLISIKPDQSHVLTSRTASEA